MRRTSIALLVSSFLLAFPASAKEESLADAPPEPAEREGGEVTQALPIIPGCHGYFGMATSAGSGRHLKRPKTTVRRVTSLKDEGAGSLRAALAESGPTTVVFEVSGTIDLKSPLGIGPYTTVAGQTAPSPGITLKGTEIAVGHDCLVQHIRVRVGDDPEGPDPNERDCMGMNGANIVIDHCSFSWSLDELVDTRADNITFRHCIFAEALHSPMHPKGPHSRGLFIMESDKALVIGCLFAHNAARNPVIGGSRAIVVNNLIYNYMGGGIRVKDYKDKTRKKPTQQSVVNNAIIPGADSNPPKYSIQLWGVGLPESRVCVRGNLIGGETQRDDWSVIWLRDVDVKAVKVKRPPIWIKGLKPHTAKKVEAWVLAHAGARPADRDAVDERVIRDVRKRKGRIIKSQRDVGGWPKLAENHRRLALPPNPNGDKDRDGYTNLEEWLHGLAAEVE